MFVAVDMGACSSRFCSVDGYIRVIPNNMVSLPTLDVTTLKEEPGDVENNLEVQIRKNSGEVFDNCFPANVLLGFMAEKDRSVAERPSVMSHKHTQSINYISAVVCTALEVLRNGGASSPIALYLAVPPVEVHKAEEAFRSGLIGKYEVYFPKFNGGVKVEFEIGSVDCTEESFMAVTSFFFDLSGKVRDIAKAHLRGKVISLDIGASTTDLAIIQDGKYLDKSGQTYRIGGNVARDELTALICEKYAIDLPIADAEKTMAEGRLQLGNSYTDASVEVDEAKRGLANQLIQYMQTYFKRIGIPIQMINTIIVSGGGSVQSQYITDDGEVVKTSEPMSHYVTQAMLEWSPSTEVVEYGDEARFANIKGLFIKAKLTEKKKIMASQVTQAPNANVAPAAPVGTNVSAPEATVSTGTAVL